MKTYDVTITIYLGNQAIQQMHMTSIQPMIEAQFMAYVQEVASQKQPMRVVMTRDEVIWDKFEQKQKVIPCSMEFQNYEGE
jgi:peroxiredoxin family protein